MSFIKKAKSFIAKNVSVGSDILRIDTLIGKNTSIEGQLIVTGNCKIDGVVVGNITVSGDLVIGKDASITGDISAVNVVIAGSVTGNISAKGQLSIKQTAKARGEHTAYSIIADEGSSFVGTCSILEREV